MAKGTGKNSIKVGLIDGNSKKEEVSLEAKKALESKENLAPEEVSKDAKPALLISVVDYPITIDYGDEKIRLTGRAKEEVKDKSKLGEIPKGVKLKEL